MTAKSSSAPIIQRLGAWSGPIGMALFGIAITPFMLTFHGPIPPSLSAAEVADFYRVHANGIRGGAIFGIAGATAFGAFSAAITSLLKRIEGPTSPCAYLQLAGGILSVLGFLLPMMIWVVASFRPDRDPANILLLSDLGWTLLVMPAWTGNLQLLSITAAILLDRSPDPLLPRWLAYLSLWAELLFLPALGMGFFQHGPFAWNGLLSFWLAATAFSVWLIAMCVCMLRADRQTDRFSGNFAPA